MGSSFSDGINDVIRDAMQDVQRALEETGTAAGDVDDPQASARDPLERSFEVGPGSELAVGNISGEIKIHSEPGNIIRVRASKRGSPSRAATTMVNMAQDGNRVTVMTRGSNSGLLALGRATGRVDYRISVPPDCSVRINTVGGEVEVRDIHASVTIESVSGDMRLQGVKGDLSVTSVSGDIVAHDLVGVLVVRTTSGDIAVGDARLERFNLNSVSGDFSIETPLVNGEHYFAKTVSGDLHLRIPPSTGAMIQLRTTSGDVNCSLPAEIIKAGRRHWQGRINGGGATVEMNSVSGDLLILAGSDIPSGSPVTPVSPDSYQPRRPDRAEEADAEPAVPEESETSKVLRLLEQGEITVEEAMSRLDAL